MTLNFMLVVSIVARFMEQKIKTLKLLLKLLKVLIEQQITSLNLREILMT